MGTHYYVVIPKLKIIIWIGRNILKDSIEEDEEIIKEFLNIWSSYNYEGDVPVLNQIKDLKLKDFKVEDIMTISFYLFKLEKFLGLQNYPFTILKYFFAKSIDKNSYIISDYDMDKLEKLKYKIIEED